MNLDNQFRSPVKQQIIHHIQVNIPFTWLIEPSWLNLFIEYGLNPEIGLDSAALDEFSLSDFKDIADNFISRHKSITIHGPFLDLSPGSPDPKIRAVSLDRFRQLITAVSIFKPRTVVCHAGYDDARYNFFKEAWLEYSIEAWQWLGNELNAHGTKLMLENVYESDPDEMLMLFQYLDTANIGCCLDIGHQSVFGRKTLNHWFNVMGPYIGQLHLHDNHGDCDSHLGMGNGKINFDPMFRFLKKLPMQPVVTLEPHNREDLAASLAYLEQSDFLSLFR